MTKKGKDEPVCSFCGRAEEAVDKLISGLGSYICDKCVRLCVDIIEKKPQLREIRWLTPQEIKAGLDLYVIGQEQAKKTLSVAVYNHYKRIRSKRKDRASDVEYGKSNILIVGPTGSGKTLLVRILALLIGVPLSISDATTFTESGYVGEDVENCVLSLVQRADYDIALAETGIICIDEVDKLRKTSANISITRDVSGEGVQQALLKLVEGTVANVPPKGGRKHPNQEYLHVDTSNILFIVMGAFEALPKIIAKRLKKRAIGFDFDGSGHLVDPKDVSYLLSLLEPEDLIECGMIPEFVGRFPCNASCQALTAADLESILLEPKNAIVKQYQQLFAEDDIELVFRPCAIQALAQKAQAAGTGARALRMLVEKLLLECMFEAPSDKSIKQVVIDDHSVKSGKVEIIHR